MPSDPSIPEERLTATADAFAALIAARPYLAGVPVNTERTGDISATIRDALSKLGVSVTVVAPDADSLVRRGDAISLRVRLVAQVTELYLVNQSASGLRKPALAVATAVMKAVDRKPNGLDVGQHRPGLNEFLLPDEIPFQIKKDPRFVVYQVTAYTTVEL